MNSDNSPSTSDRTSNEKGTEVQSTTTQQQRHEYHLWELTDKASSKEVYELAQMAAELHVDANPTGTLRGDEWDDDAKTMVYAIHRKLWEMPRKPDNTHPPFTHKIVNSTSVLSAARQAFPQWAALWSAAEFNRMAQRAYRILAGNQLLVRIGQGSRTAFFLIRAWPDGYEPGYYSQSHYLPVRDEADIARQEKKAAELAGPVKVTYNLESIPAPEPNPKSVMEYLEKLKGLIGKLVAENAELRDQLENKEGWNAVVEAIKETGTVIDGARQ